ncbi:MAG TPA: YcfL family protein [Candidatus Methylacidiphilales bacterium]
MKRILSLSALGAVLVLASGCVEGPVAPAGNDASPEAVHAPVTLLDTDLEDVVAVDVIRAGKNTNGLLAVQANVRNRTDRDVVVQVQTLFYDENGLVLYSEPGNETAWTTLTLGANATIPYRSQALSNAAKRYTLHIRRPLR